MTSTLNFAKGHGTRNDFVVVLDRDGLLPLTVEQVRWLCDRRSGIGGDGLLRVVRAQHIADWTGEPDLWFMDYRNADGSVAEMCGNGLRVFVRYLIEEGLVGSEPAIQVGTRVGLLQAWLLPDGRIRIGLGPVRVAASPGWIKVMGRRFEAWPVDAGPPHSVVILPADQELSELQLQIPPRYEPRAHPHGTNIDFIVPHGPNELRMRVHERGVGETESCGTGAIASAAVWLANQQRPTGRVSVQLPGGVLEVEIGPDGAFLIGPAVIVARGSVTLPV